ncbi:hypothetical protein TNCV_2272681, partial [Trichonephila clavipes]
SRERLVFLSTGTSRTLDSQTPGSRTAVHVLMGEKKCLERRNLTESTIVRRSIDIPPLNCAARGEESPCEKGVTKKQNFQSTNSILP